MENSEEMSQELCSANLIELSDDFFNQFGIQIVTDGESDSPIRLATPVPIQQQAVGGSSEHHTRVEGPQHNASWDSGNFIRVITPTPEQVRLISAGTSGRHIQVASPTLEEQEQCTEQKAQHHQVSVAELRKQRKLAEQSIPKKVQIIAGDSGSYIRVAIPAPEQAKLIAAGTSGRHIQVVSRTKEEQVKNIEQPSQHQQASVAELQKQRKLTEQFNEVEIIAAGESGNSIRVDLPTPEQGKLTAAGTSGRHIQVVNLTQEDPEQFFEQQSQHHQASVIELNKLQYTAADDAGNSIRVATPTPEQAKLIAAGTSGRHIQVVSRTKEEQVKNIEQSSQHHQASVAKLRKQRMLTEQFNEVEIIAAGESGNSIRVALPTPEQGKLTAAETSGRHIQVVNLTQEDPEQFFEQQSQHHQASVIELNKFQYTAADDAGNSIRVATPTPEQAKLTAAETSGRHIQVVNLTQEDPEQFFEQQSQHHQASVIELNKFQYTAADDAGNSIRVATPTPEQAKLIAAGTSGRHIQVVSRTKEEQVKNIEQQSQHHQASVIELNKFQYIAADDAGNSIRVATPTPEQAKRIAAETSGRHIQVVCQTKEEQVEDIADVADVFDGVQQHQGTGADPQEKTELFIPSKAQRIASWDSGNFIRVATSTPEQAKRIAAGTSGRHIQVVSQTKEEQVENIEQSSQHYQSSVAELRKQRKLTKQLDEVQIIAAGESGNSFRVALPTPEQGKLTAAETSVRHIQVVNLTQEDPEQFFEQQSQHHQASVALNKVIAADDSGNSNRVAIPTIPTPEQAKRIATGTSREFIRTNSPTPEQQGQGAVTISPTPSSSQSAGSSWQITSPNPHPPVFDPEYLKTLLSQDLEGQQILEKAKNGELIEAKQNKLAKVIAQYHVSYKTKLTKADLELYSLAVTSLFPNERKETYFIPRGGSRKNHAGKIANKIGNYKHALQDEEKKEKKAHANTPNEGDTDDDDINEETRWLLVNRVPWTTVLDRWPASFVYRDNYLRKAKQVPKLLKDFAHYKDPCGYQLVDLDFARLFPNAPNGLDRLISICSDLRPYIEKKAVDPSKVRLLQLLESEDHDIKVYSLILILSTILPPITAARKYKPTILGAQDDSILIAADDVEAREKVEFLYVAYEAQGFPLVPKLVFLGSGPENFEGVFIVSYIGVYYKFESAGRALDALIKLTAVFGLPYSKLSRLVWQFISGTIFGLDQKETYSSIAKVNRYLQNRAECSRV